MSILSISSAVNVRFPRNPLPSRAKSARLCSFGIAFSVLVWLLLLLLLTWPCSLLVKDWIVFKKIDPSPLTGGSLSALIPQKVQRQNHDHYLFGRSFYCNSTTNHSIQLYFSLFLKSLNQLFAIKPAHRIKTIINVSI